MPSAVFTRAVLDRWKGMTIGAAAVVAMLLFGMLAYRDIDTSFYTDLPEAFRALFNIAGDAAAAGLAYGAIYSSYGALTLASLAVSVGAGSIAGEERAGTLGLLLGNPVSRTRVVLEKEASMVALTAAGAALLLAGGLAVPVMLGVSTDGMDVAALTLHMFVIAVFFGTLALAIGSATGRRGAASGISATVMAVSFIAVGILPLVGGWEWVSWFFPWHYYDASEPVRNGVAWGHLGVLTAASAAFVAAAVPGFRRRDVTDRGTPVTVLDRLRTNPRTRKLMDRIAGSARVSRISVKTVSDHQALTVVVGSLMFLMSIFIGLFYLVISDLIKDFATQFPEAILAMIGYADLGTIEGWYQTEVFSMTVPVGFLVVTGIVGAKALAGEEADRTMGLLVANPVRRSRVVAEKAAAMAGIAVLLGALTWVGTMLGTLMAGLSISPVGVAAACIQAVLLSLVFGMLSLAISAGTGRTRLATFGMAGIALLLYVVDAFFPLSEALAGLARWSPFHYYLGGDPLNNGMHWGHAGILASLATVLFAASIVLFERRDLRQGD
jgi:ABC-2 type transport system permease protein